MSAYVKVKLGKKITGSPQCVARALAHSLGLKPEVIEIHKRAQNLVGYLGKTRPETAEVIVRRKWIGYASNDMGFKYKAATKEWSPVISGFDNHGKFADRWKKKFMSEWAAQNLMEQRSEQGWKCQRDTVDVDGRQHIRIRMTGRQW